MSIPDGSAEARSSTSTGPQAVSTVVPADRSDAIRRKAPEENAACFEDGEHRAPHRAGRTDNRHDPVAHAGTSSLTSGRVEGHMQQPGGIF